MSESSVSPLPRVAPVLAPVGARSRPHAELGPMSGFLVLDVRGRLLGRVDRSPGGETPGPLPIRFGFLRVRRRLVPAESIEEIDGRAKVISLCIDRKTFRARRS